MHAGETVTVTVRGNRADGSAHRDGAVAEFFAPGRDPRRDPGDREPDHAAPLSFDPVTRAYAADIRTVHPDGQAWLPGAWTVRGAVTDADGLT